MWRYAVSKLVRKLVGFDTNTAMEEFSEFLNSSQIHFVKLIVGYVIKNGIIDDNRVLTEDPFRIVGNIVELFKDDIDIRSKLLVKIKEIKENALEIG